jgi:hypothetical protein
MPTQLLITAAIAAVALIGWIVMLRVVTAGEPVDLADLFRNPAELPWPRGVQEEEPQPWRLELLDRRSPTALADRARQGSRKASPKVLVPEDRAA